MRLKVNFFYAEFEGLKSQISFVWIPCNTNRFEFTVFLLLEYLPYKQVCIHSFPSSGSFAIQTGLNSHFSFFLISCHTNRFEFTGFLLLDRLPYKQV